MLALKIASVCVVTFSYSIPIKILVLEGQK